MASQAHTSPSGGSLLAGHPLAGNPLAGTALTGTEPAGPPDGSLAGVHACSLVSAAVVAKVLGPLSSRPYETSDGRDCFYETAVPGGSGPTYILSVVTRSGFEASKAFSEGASESGAARFTHAPGLGDDAFALSTATGPDYTLWAARGGLGVSLDVNDLGGPGMRNARELIAAALGHL